MYRAWLNVLLAGICATAPLTVVGQDAAKDVASAIAPFLDEQAIAVAHVAVEDAEIPKAVSALLTSVAVSEEEQKRAGEMAAAARQWLEQIRAAGVEHLFLVISIDDIPRPGPFVVASFGDEGDRDEISRLLASGRFPVVEPLGEAAVVAGPETTIERLRQQVGGRNVAPPAAQLVAALSAVPRRAAKVVVVPSEAHRRVIREMLPAVDWPLQGISGELIADGLVWAAIAFDPAEPSFQAIVKSDNEVAAARFRQRIDRGLELAADVEAVRQVLDNPQEVFAILEPRLEGDRIVWNLDAGSEEVATFIDSVLSPPLRAARLAAQRRQRMHQFRQIGLAMHNYHDVNKAFPSQTIRDEEGRPLLSWRVAILPYIDQKALYEQFRLDEPWDSPHNRKLVEQMPETYADPDLPELAAEGRTTFQVPAHAETIFPPPPNAEGVPIKEIKDGTSMTVALVEVVPDQAVPWTKPDDWDVDPDNPLAGVRRDDREAFTALRADGSSHFISNKFDPQIWWRLLTRAGGEPIPR
jgi:hypothetical protein